ncbi:hypothetical protein K4K48_003252 [Colletotrichum sp. SAR 10_66]|nr:hypothetical protein K4K48_003252 [Colletotrichum sp. SAR 10_66]
MDTALWWTHDFADSFRTQRGYDIATCLPFLIQRENYWAAQNLPYGESFLSQDNNTLVSRCNDDYRLTLQDTRNTFAQRRNGPTNGLEYSNQPAYNLPLNMLDSILLVNAPEGESLGFNDSPSLYRHLSGPAHMARNSVISTEAGAVNGASYTQTIQHLLRTVCRGLAGVLSMNPRFISQIGTARVDLAFYQYAAPFAKVVYDSDNLEKLGFTYDYLGPASFSSSNAIVGEGGVLAPDGPAYKALIFANQTKLTPEMAAQTKAFAEAGLSIFVIGSTDFQSVGVDGAASVPEIMANALAMEGVTVLASAEELPAALAALNIRPRVSFLDVAGRTPYTLDAWTGSVSPLLQYTIEENHVVVPVTLAANQTAILVFSNQTSASGDKNGTSILPCPPSTHITSISGLLKALVYTATQDVNTTTATNNTRITAHLAPGTATVSLATGQTLIFTASQLPEVTELDAWNITVNDWRSEDHIFSMETAITPHRFLDSRLASWKDMHPVNLGNTSGTADYVTTFRTPFSSVEKQPLGAHLHLGAITDATLLWVNRDKVIFDVNSSPDVVVDITKYLNPADANNVVKVEVASTLYNRVRAEQDSIMTFGVAASVAGASFFNANPTKEHGLKGPVLIQWVEVVDVL